MVDKSAEGEVKVGRKFGNIVGRYGDYPNVRKQKMRKKKYWNSYPKNKKEVLYEALGNIAAPVSACDRSSPNVVARGL